MKQPKPQYGFALLAAGSVLLHTAALPCTAAEDEILTENGFAYALTAEGATVTEYVGTAAYVTIPDTLGGAAVTAIGDYAFSPDQNGKASLSVTMPDTVTSIGDYAFYDCNALKTVTLSPNLTEIGAYAFAEMASLTELELPSALESV